MSLSDDLAAITPLPPEGVCNVAALDLTPAEAILLTEVLRDETLPTEDIAEVLRRHGFDVTAFDVRQHRHYRCVCTPRQP